MLYMRKKKDLDEGNGHNIGSECRYTAVAMQLYTNSVKYVKSAWTGECESKAVCNRRN